MSDYFHIERESQPIPAADREARGFDVVGEAEALPDEDIEAAEELWREQSGEGVDEDAQPETQGEDPLDAELGEEGQGEYAPEDEQP